MFCREQILSPISFVDKIGYIDIEGSVEGSGIASQAGAVRHAVSLGVAAFEETEVQEKMRQGKTPVLGFYFLHKTRIIVFDPQLLFI